MSSLTPGSEFGGHRIESVIAGGGMGVVYRATHLTLELPVALKVISPEHAGDITFRERFRREARVAALIDNPHVIPVRDAGEADGLLYISMRLIEGPTISRLVGFSEKLDPELAVDLTEQVADGLDAAHAAGLVHRDVKPANVLVENFPERPHAFLTDFGITRRQTVADDLTLTGKFVGSIDYVAPEQIRGESVDGRSDVYALAGMLSFMLTGSPPYPAENSAAKIYSHLNDEAPRLPPGTPGAEGLNAVIAKGMSKDPGARYATAGELAKAAREALDEAPTEALAAPGTGSDGTTSEQPVPTAEATAGGGTTAGGTTERVIGGTGGPNRRRLALVGGILAAAIVAVAALALGGGGGGGGGGQAPDPMFVADANAICTQIESGVQELYDGAGGQMVEGDAAIAVLRRRADIIRAGVNDLKAMTDEVPPGERAAFRSYWKTRAEFASGVDQLASARERGDQSAVSAISQQQLARFNQKVAIGRELGLDICGDDLPPNDLDEVNQLATEWVNGDDSDMVCSDLVSETFLNAEFGGQVSACTARQPDLEGGKVVRTTGIKGVHGLVQMQGPGGAGVLAVVFQDDKWKVDGWKGNG